MIDIIINCNLFNRLEREDLTEIFNNIPKQIKSFAKESIIAFANEEVKYQLILLEGTVAGEMVDFSGKTIKIEEIQAPRLLAPAFLFGQQNTFPVNITALTETKIIYIEKNNFIKLLMSNNLILENYLNITSNRAQFLSSKIRFLSFQSIKGKFAFFILNIAKKTNSLKITLPKSQKEMAELFGVARPSLGRAVREMHEEGIINAQGKQIEILDKKRLTGLLK